MALYHDSARDGAPVVLTLLAVFSAPWPECVPPDVCIFRAKPMCFASREVSFARRAFVSPSGNLSQTHDFRDLVGSECFGAVFRAKMYVFRVLLNVQMERHTNIKPQ